MRIALLLAAFIGACSEDRIFVNVGDHIAVPRSTITRRANEKGITRQEAAREIGAELRARRAVE